ncbi:ABC transporter substrate-binding protein [Marispirochaeta aestuarii]|uniref:glycine betaine ABC transporter substrate-binding protein OsmF n=1 Tax=Marispirochaeta aestuarii TaxID=1963862 RepID=UPI0029C71C35|nr:ABC transporter substrate-binding protein [Marispirochaeta aestuarii]
MKRLTALILITLAVNTVFPAGGSEESQTAKGPITVASKIDTEGALLGNMIMKVLDENGFAVDNRTEFGPTDVVRKAIIAGEIDIYPEYTGNGGFFFSDTPSDVWKDREAGYELVKKLDLEQNNLVWLQPAPANNTWAIAIRRDIAEPNKLKSLEDLADYINSGGKFKIAGSEEFATRPDALPAFEKAYGFSLSEDQMLILSGGNTATTEQAASRGTSGVNAAMAYGTDGQLAALGLVVMEDSRGVQPVYEPAPIIRKEVLDRYPEIADLLNPVFGKLDLVTLQELNAKIAVEGMSAETVAEEWLADSGLLK